MSNVLLPSPQSPITATMANTKLCNQRQQLPNPRIIIMKPTTSTLSTSASSSSGNLCHHENQNHIKVQRGKTGTIQLEEPEDLTLVSLEEDDEPHQARTKQTQIKGAANITSSSSAASPPSPNRWKEVLQKVVQSPWMLWMTCGNHVQDTDPSNPTPKHSWPSKAKTILQTMKQFPYQSRIQKIGLMALRDMAVDSWQGKLAVLESGAVEQGILKAMKLHVADPALQLLAAQCLYEIVLAIPDADTEEPRQIITSLLQVMEQHDQDEDVLLMALKVLLALTDQGPLSLECLRHKLGGVLLAKLEQSWRGLNNEISHKAGKLLKRLYL